MAMLAVARVVGKGNMSEDGILVTESFIIIFQQMR